MDDDDDCSDYVPSDDDNEEDIILSDPEYDSEDNNDNAEASDASGRYITNTSTALFTSKSGVESWAAEPLLPLTSKTSQRNIIREKSGPTRYAIRMSGSLGDCFLCFSEIIFWKKYVNGLIKRSTCIFKYNWEDATVAELKKVIGTLLLVGVYKSSNEDLSQLWHMEHGRPIFRKIISLNRFQNILRVLRFDDAAARRSARSPDKFSPSRNVFEIWNKSLLDAYVPETNLTIDEQLVTFRGRCPFCQYMPTKPGKYGIKIWAICNSTTHYVLKMDVYKGREIGEPRETNLGSKVVLKLSEPFQKSGRNITSDNFFTNLELERKLLMQNLTIVETIRKNRKELPAEFVSTKDRKEFTTLYGFQKEAMIASYCSKKGKVVTLLSTMHLVKGTESPGPEK